MKKILSAIFALSLISSCAALNSFKKPDALDSLNSDAKFDVKKFFNGDLEGFAIIQDSDGKIIETQKIKINGKWDENKGVIQQDFIYSGGQKDSRTWLVTIDGQNSFSAIGHDIAAPAQGKQVGNAMQMLYSLMLLNGNEKTKSKVNFADKIYLVDEKSAIMISDSTIGFSAPKRAIFSLKKLGKD